MAKKKTAPKALTKSVAPTHARDLSPAPYNPRNITPEQLETLGLTMAEFGDLSGIVFNTRTRNIVGGHQRLKHIDPQWAIERQSATDSTGTVALGKINTPWGAFSYREVNWPVEKEQAANLAANKAGGDFDFDAVARMLNEIDGKIDFNLTGFSDEEVGELLKRVSDLPAPLVPFSEFEDNGSSATPASVDFSFGDYDAQVPQAVYAAFKKRVDAEKKKNPSALIADIIESMIK